MSDFVLRASIKSRSITVFPYYFERKKSARSSTPPLRKEAVDGQLFSQRARTRLRTALDVLIYSANWKTVFVRATNTYFRYKINFITLTLPSTQKHTDKEIVKKCLTPFLNNWQRRRKGLLYVYKAEVQDNQNIHFHIVSNAFYHYENLRRDWNKCINKLNYVDECKYENPNSTDVHALSNKGDVASYLSSYMSKKDLYSKALKRYHKIFKEKLAKNDREFTPLPQNYFSNVKRSIGTNSWNCSIALKGFKAISDCDYSQVSWRMLAKIREFGGFRKFDFCEQMYYELNGFEEFPEFKHLVDQKLEEVIKIQNENVISEEIESL